MNGSRLHEPHTRRAELGAVAAEIDEETKSDRARELCKELTAEWLLQDAIAASDFLAVYPLERVEALAEIARRFGAVGNRPECQRLLSLAGDIASEIDRAWQQGEALLLVSRGFRAAEEARLAQSTLAAAIAAVQAGQGDAQTQEEVDCASVLREAAEEVAIRGDVANARAIARSITNPGFRQRALERIEAIAAAAGGRRPV